jgi:hypothetical protein
MDSESVAMTSEVTIELPGRVGSLAELPHEDQSPKRQPAMIAVLLWPISIACVGFTMCYAYHLGF